jgi:hypothetical protein
MRCSPITGTRVPVWQQFGNNIGRVTPMRLQCTTVTFVTFPHLRTRLFYVTPTCSQCHANGRRAGLKIRSPQEGVRVQVSPSVPKDLRRNGGGARTNSPAILLHPLGGHRRGVAQSGQLMTPPLQNSAPLMARGVGNYPDAVSAAFRDGEPKAEARAPRRIAG